MGCHSGPSRARGKIEPNLIALTPDTAFSCRYSICEHIAGIGGWCAEAVGPQEPAPSAGGCCPPDADGFDGRRGVPPRVGADSGGLGLLGGGAEGGQFAAAGMPAGGAWHSQRAGHSRVGAAEGLGNDRGAAEFPVLHAGCPGPAAVLAPLAGVRPALRTTGGGVLAGQGPVLHRGPVARHGPALPAGDLPGRIRRPARNRR